MERLKTSHKGIAVSQLTSIAMVFVLVGIIIAVGTYVNQQYSETVFVGTSIANETINFTTNQTYVTLSTHYVKSITAIYCNASQSGIGAAWPTDRWAAMNTSDNEQNMVKIYTNTTYRADTPGGTCPNVSTGLHYIAYVPYTSDIEIAKNATVGMSKLAEWTPIIAIAIAAGIIIAAIAVWFRGRREEA